MRESKRILRETIDTQAKLIKNRDNKIDQQTSYLAEYQHTINLLDKTVDEQYELLNRIKDIAITYSNKEIAINKIKELVNDYQSKPIQ